MVDRRVLGCPNVVPRGNIGGFGFGSPMLATKDVLFGCTLVGSS